MNNNNVIAHAKYRRKIETCEHMNIGKSKIIYQKADVTG